MRRRHVPDVLLLRVLNCNTTLFVWKLLSNWSLLKDLFTAVPLSTCTHTSSRHIILLLFPVERRKKERKCSR